MKLVIPGVFALIAGFALWLFVYLGAYEEPELHGLVKRDFPMLYEKHLGPYHKIKPSLDRVQSWAKSGGISCNQTFGRFIDNPRTTEAERLRSQVGCLVDRQLKELPEQFEFQHLKERNYLKLSFSGAPSLGPMKVYPRAEKWFAEHGYTRDGPAIEVYTLIGESGVRTDYYLPATRTPTDTSD